MNKPYADLSEPKIARIELYAVICYYTNFRHNENR